MLSLARRKIMRSLVRYFLTTSHLSDLFRHPPIYQRTLFNLLSATWLPCLAYSSPQYLTTAQLTVQPRRDLSAMLERAIYSGS